MALIIEPAIQAKIISLISALVPDAKIYLYGSRARGTNKEWSDIDLALDAGRELPLGAVGELASILEASSIPYKIDIVDINGEISKVMRESILKDKMVWKQCYRTY